MADHFQVPLGASDLIEEEFRGVRSTAMAYRYAPVVDFFRRVDEDAVVGISVLRGNPSASAFFHLERHEKL